MGEGLAATTPDSWPTPLAQPAKRVAGTTALVPCSVRKSLTTASAYSLQSPSSPSIPIKPSARSSEKKQRHIRLSRAPSPQHLAPSADFTNLPLQAIIHEIVY